MRLKRSSRATANRRSSETHSTNNHIKVPSFILSGAPTKPRCARLSSAHLAAAAVISAVTSASRRRKKVRLEKRNVRGPAASMATKSPGRLRPPVRAGAHRSPISRWRESKSYKEDRPR
jgi:hypothetical protein